MSAWAAGLDSGQRCPRAGRRLDSGQRFPGRARRRDVCRARARCPLRVQVDLCPESSGASGRPAARNCAQNQTRHASPASPDLASDRRLDSGHTCPHGRPDLIPGTDLPASGRLDSGQRFPGAAPGAAPPSPTGLGRRARAAGRGPPGAGRGARPPVGCGRACRRDACRARARAASAAPRVGLCPESSGAARRPITRNCARNQRGTPRRFTRPGQRPRLDSVHRCPRGRRLDSGHRFPAGGRN